MALLSRGKRPPHLSCRFLILGCLVVAAGRAGAQVPAAPPELEAEVKAAYLFNFTRYVEWPPGTFVSAEDPVKLCVLGADAFGEVVQRVVEGRRSRGRPVTVLRPDTPEPAVGCHVAFLAGSSRAVRRWLSTLDGAPTLTVGDGAGFLGRGGTIAFVIVDETVRFEIDQTAARRAGLQISSRVLSLATRVRDRGDPR